MKVQKLKTKPMKAEAVQFTGKNSKEVADWVKENGGKARAGGSYVSVWDHISETFIDKARKDEWVVKMPDGSFITCDTAWLEEFYTLLKG